MKEIGCSAFSTCEFLGTLTILDGVKEIGEEAFESNTELETVTIPGSVTKIGKGAFSKCYRIAAINFGGTKEQWQAIIAAAGGSVVEDGVTVCCTDGFIADMPSYLTVEGTVLMSCQKTEKEVIIPDGITEIGGRVHGGGAHQAHRHTERGRKDAQKRRLQQNAHRGQGLTAQQVV